jgi:hypothetical protein
MFVLVLAACETEKGLTAITPPSADERVVFGQVRGTVDGYVMNYVAPWQLKLGPQDRLALIVMAEAGGEAQTYFMRDDGRFEWNLRPGRYIVAGVEWTKDEITGPYSRRSAHRVARPWLGFAVSEEPAATYLGTLRVDLNRGQVRYRIEDNFAAARAAFAAKLPALADKPVRQGLMARVEEPTRSANVHPICEPRWGLAVCSDKRHGIAPLQPAAAQDVFPVVDSLQPTLEWEPAPRSELRYDLAVWKVVDYRHLLLTRRLQGPVAYYRAGLVEPRHKLEVPLDPGTRYYWSVRLREMDTVSSWSTFGTGYFVLVAYGESSNLMFNFATPSR